MIPLCRWPGNLARAGEGEGRGIAHTGKTGYAGIMVDFRAVLLIVGGVLLLPVAAGLAPGGPSSWTGEASAAEFETGVLTLVTPRGRFPFKIELATNEDQRRQGLQFRRSLAADAGMLFDFGETAPVSMWMLNTPISLDMVFFDAAGRVTQVVEDTTPLSTDIIASGGPVRGVLEVAAGTARRLGVHKGARILHPLFDDR